MRRAFWHYDSPRACRKCGVQHFEAESLSADALREIEDEATAVLGLGTVDGKCVARSGTTTTWARSRDSI